MLCVSSQTFGVTINTRNMDFIDSAAILLLIGLGWIWWDSLRVRERVITLALQACQGAQVQLLDHTVALKKIWFGRKRSGHVALLRSYEFEFSSTGTERRKGLIVVLGMVQQYFSMDLPQSRTITVDRDV